MPSPAPLAIDSFARFDDEKPAIHTLAESGHAKLLLVCLKAGQVLKDHKSSSQVTAHFLRGSGVFAVDGTPARGEPGTLFLVAPGRFHRIHADSDCVVLVILTPHPAGERYPRDQRDRIVSASPPQAGPSDRGR
jgi:quercetin dioxygenase-like cupin family protein